MRKKLDLLMLLLLAAPAPSEARTWRFTRLTQPPGRTFFPPRCDFSPSVGSGGVAWIAYASDVPRVLAFYDGFSVSFLTPPRFAPSVAGVPLSVNPYDIGPRDPSLSGSAIAFSAWTLASRGPGEVPRFFGSEEILLWENGTIHRITYDESSDKRPSLYERSIAWQSRASEDDDWEIRYWDGYGVRTITDNDVDDTHPSLYDGTIAWRSDGHIVYVTAPCDVYQKLPAAVVVGPGDSPSIFSTKIAYHASDGNDTEIFLYEVDTGNTTQITDNDYNDRNACLHDGTIVWEGHDGNDWEIFYWDGNTIEQLTDNDVDDREPSLWGTGLATRIAYVERQVPPYFSYLETCIILARPAATIAPGPGVGELTITWPSLEGRTYRVEYSDDLLTWHVAADDLPSAGYGETSWTDDIAPGTVTRRFYRIAEKE